MGLFDKMKDLNEMRKQAKQIELMLGSEEVIGKSSGERIKITIDGNQIIFSDLPNEVAKSLPRYPNVPAYRIGRLAVNKEHQGKGIGALLLMDALFKCLNKEIPVVAVIVDAKNNHATDFYKKYGFIQFPDQPLKLFIPVKVIKNTFVK